MKNKEDVMIYASSKGCTEVVKFLLESGVDPNVREEEQNRDTALMKAVKNNHKDVVKLLLLSKF